VAVTVLDADPAPAEFCAETRKLWTVFAVSPVIVAVVFGDVPSLNVDQDEPPFVENSTM
jgi:hypothetical protein